LAGIKNPRSAFAKAGWLSLAVFLKRPQAEYQIGAQVNSKEKYLPYVKSL